MEILDLNNDEDTKTTDEMEPKKPEEKTSPVKEILSWVLTIAFAIVAAILIKNYVIINANIPSGSMENTIQIGDDIFGFCMYSTCICETGKRVCKGSDAGVHGHRLSEWLYDHRNERV